MGDILYSPRNLARDAASSDLYTAAGSVLTAPAGFEVARGIDLRPGTVLRFPSLATGRAVFDFNASPGGQPSSTPGIAGLINHNLATDAVVRVQSSGSVSGPWSNRGVFDLSGGDKKLWCTISGVAAAVWAIYIESLGSSSSLPQFECWIGTPVRLTRRAAWGVTPDGRIYRTRTVESEYGWESIDFLSQSDRFIGQLPQGISDAELAEIVELYDSQRGNTDPLLWVGDDAKLKAFIGRMRLAELDPQAVAAGKWSNVRLEVTEVPWGKQPHG
jgi:hypothetical protein